MNNIIFILSILLLLIMEYILINDVLHIFQQNKYDYRRFTNWIIKNLKATKMFIVSIFIVGFSSVLGYKIHPYIFVVLTLINTVIIVEAKQKKEYIKPLVYTSRIKREIFVILILNIMFISLFLKFVNYPYKLYIIPICLYINWIFVYIADFILKPVEFLIQRHYLNDAKRILNSHENLIKIGITGSFGKTSSKNIVQAIINEEYRSLMTPASFNTPMGITRCIRESLKPTHQVFVCEMGADHVNDIKYLCDFVKPKYSVVTSIGPQHLETFKTLENIINEKMQIIETLDSDGVGILNYDNEYIKNYKIKNNCRIITYGIDSKKVDFKATDIKYSVKGSSFKVKNKRKTYQFETKLLGKHNISNILAGIALSRELNIEWNDIIKAVKNINYIEHRLELKKINGYTFIDNAFNSNPVGAAMSLEVMKMMQNKRIIVTPGMIDLGKIQDEVNYNFGLQMKGSIDIAILVGEKQTESIKKGLIDSKFDEKNIYVCKTVKEAFALVYKIASFEDTILLENDLPDAFNN